MTDTSEKTELGLLPRLIAAGWFALAACIPVLFFLLTFGRVWERGLEHLNGRFVFFYGEVPSALAGLFGFAIGVRILDPVKSMSVGRAALRGAGVALLSYVVFISLYVILMQVSHPASPVGFVALVLIIGSAYMLWPVVISGAVAGWLLCRISCQAGFWEWLLNLPRVTETTANVWISIATAAVTLNCAAGIYFVRFVRS